MIDRSGLTNRPPLKPAIGVLEAAAARTASPCPRGGRPLVMAKRMPASCRRCDGRLGAVGQHLVLGDQRAVDVRQQQRDFRRCVMAQLRDSVSRAAARRARRAPAAVGRVRARRCRRHSSGSPSAAFCRPGIQDRLHDAPARLDHVGALEQRRVADHARRRSASRSRVRLASGTSPCSGNPCCTVAERRPPGRGAWPRTAARCPRPAGCCSTSQLGGSVVDVRVAEQRVGRLLEADGDLGRPRAPCACRCAGRTARRPSASCRSSACSAT